MTPDAPRFPGSTPRRLLLRLAAGAAAAAVAGCDASAASWHGQDVTGAMPSLAFQMTDATTGRTVTAADFRGRIVMLTFGYTFCPDICPTTLTNLTAALAALGPQADQVRILFASVDPNRDTPEALRRYTALFSPEVVGLRGTPDQLAQAARRYRVAYSVSPGADPQDYQVTHSSLVYVFDRRGGARLLIAGLGTSQPDVAGTVADLHRLIDESGKPSLWERIAGLV
jgi:protein SCO1/2